jgi:hypothetical protein
MALDASLTLEERVSRGMLSAPSHLAQQIARCVARLLDKSALPIRYCEPFMGTGPFYSAMRWVIPGEAIASASGIEIDGETARTAAALWGEEGVRIFQGDFLEALDAQPPLDRPTLVMCDPPCFKPEQLKQSYKIELQDRVRKATGLRVNPLAPYYVYAFMLAAEWMADGGLAAWLVPAEFMSSKYADAMKKYLTERATLIRVHRLDPKTAGADDLWIASAIIIYRKIPPQRGAKALFSFRGPLSEPIISQEVAIEELAANPLWISYPFVRVRTEDDMTGAKADGPEK